MDRDTEDMLSNLQAQVDVLGFAVQALLLQFPEQASKVQARVQQQMAGHLLTYRLTHPDRWQSAMNGAHAALQSLLVGSETAADPDDGPAS